MHVCNRRAFHEKWWIHPLRFTLNVEVAFVFVCLFAWCLPWAPCSCHRLQDPQRQKHITLCISDNRRISRWLYKLIVTVFSISCLATFNHAFQNFLAFVIQSFGLAGPIAVRQWVKTGCTTHAVNGTRTDSCLFVRSFVCFGDFILCSMVRQCYCLLPTVESVESLVLSHVKKIT